MRDEGSKGRAVMTDYEFGQAVMAAAGCTTKRRGCMCDGQECRSPEYCNGMKPYPDPLSAVGFDALWNGIEALGWCVTIHPAKGGQTRANVWRNESGDYIRDHIDRKAALLEAAAAALGVVRETGGRDERRADE